MKALYLEWQDSSSIHGGVWKEQDAKAGSMLCKTTGFVIREDDEYIVVAGHVSPFGEMSGDMMIPKRAITKRRILSWKK